MQERIIFLRLFCGDEPEREDAVFLEARRAFFANPETDQGRILRKEQEENGVRSSIQYRFSGKKPLWIVREGRRVAQKLVCRKDGSYAVLTFDERGTTVREELYSAADSWLGVTEYRDGVLSAHAQPGGEGYLRAQQIVSEDRSVRNLRLVACPAVDWKNKEALQAVTREFGLPQAVAFTQTGALCYYEERLAEQANRCGLRSPVRATFVAAQMKEAAAGVPEKEMPSFAWQPPKQGSLFDEFFGSIPDSGQIPDAQAEEPETAAAAPAPEPTEDTALPTAEELLVDAQREMPAQPTTSTDSDQTPPTLEELFAEDAPEGETAADTAEQSPAKVDDPVLPEVEQKIFEGEDRSLLLEFSRDGSQVYAGGVRAGERDGFGIGVDLQEKSAFAGVWLYGGRCGVMMRQGEEGVMRVRFEDSASQNPELPEGENCVFGADGELLFAGSMTGEQRCGFGVAKWGAQGHRYVGAWNEDKPQGRGMELDENGVLLYEGEWHAGKREGFGTEFEQGKPVYSGQWSDGARHGEGSLTLANGHRLVARFDGAKGGEAVTEYDETGVKVYEGGWSDGKRSGTGSLFLPSGGRIDGSFDEGELAATATEFNAAGAMVYRGAFCGLERQGRGTLFENGEAVYEGDFARGRFDGTGKQIEVGSAVYVGAFAEGMRCGVGASFQNGKPQYFGQWENGVRHGCGVEYRKGEPAFAGCFENGIKNGRGNEYRDGKLLRETVCKNGEPVYMLEYDTDGEPEYIGAVYCGKRSGMGRLLGKSCECEAQGIFNEGKLVQPVPVLVQPIQELPCPDELRRSTYETLANPPQRCVVEVPFGGGLYSGHWHAGKPEGSGTLLFADHCYTGNFTAGAPGGKGRLYLSTGKTIEGVFAAEGGERIVCGEREYFVTQT